MRSRGRPVALHVEYHNRSLLRLLNNTSAYVQAYADDIVILFQGPDLDVLHTQASDALMQMDNWTQERCLSFSAAKSECIVFTWRRKWVLPQLLLRGEPVRRVTTVKYLLSISGRQNAVFRK